jgi:hypothetical protein
MAGERVKYHEPKAGEWIRPVRRGYLLACCDCGLVHRMNFRLVGGKKRKRIEFAVFLAPRRTAALRREKRKRANR